MTRKVTLTLVTGDPKAGKLLVAKGITRQVNYEGMSKAFTVTEESSPTQLEWVDEHLEVGRRDLDYILASKSDAAEEWMLPWFKKYGPPLIQVHVTRRD